MADVHLGARKYGEKAIYDDVLQAFEESLDELARERVDALVLAGDLFDSPHPDNNVMAFAVRKLRQLTSKGVKVIAARGEHDTPGRREPSPLDVLSEAIDGFTAPFPRSARPEELIDSITVKMDSVGFVVHPFMKVSVEERRELYSKVLRPLYERRIRELRSSGRKAVLVAHFSVEPILVYDAVTNLTELPDADYIALGHVHRRCLRCVTPPGRAVAWYAYPGSLYPLDVSESELQHRRGPLLVDLSGQEPSVQEVEVSVRRHYVVEAEVRDPKDVERAVRAALKDISGAPQGKEPLVHVKLRVGVKVPTRLVELASSRVARERGVIIIPHMTRVPEEEEEAASARQAKGPESLNPLDVFRTELKLDEFTSKMLMELIAAASEGSEEGVEAALDKLASWPRSLELLRGLASQ